MKDKSQVAKKVRVKKEFGIIRKVLSPLFTDPTEQHVRGMLFRVVLLGYRYTQGRKCIRVFVLSSLQKTQEYYDHLT